MYVLFFLRQTHVMCVLFYFRRFPDRAKWYHFKAYRLIIPSQRLLHPSQQNYYRKISPKHRALITYIPVLALPEVNNSSRDFLIDSNLVSF